MCLAGQAPATPASAADAMAMVQAGLGWLAAADAAVRRGAAGGAGCAGEAAGPEDERTKGQRLHDALEDACRRLIGSGCLPDRAGQPEPPPSTTRMPLTNMMLLCTFHHLIAVHRWGWGIAPHPDGTVTATSPDGDKTLHSHGPPPPARAA